MTKEITFPMFKPEYKFTKTENGVVASFDKSVEAVKEAIASQWSGEPLSGRIGLQVVFYFTPPKRARAAQRAAMLADEEYPRIAQRKLDKYLRIVVDSLVGTVCTDEKQIALIGARVAYGETEGGTVEVGPVLSADEIAAAIAA